MQIHKGATAVATSTCTAVALIQEQVTSVRCTAEAGLTYVSWSLQLVRYLELEVLVEVRSYYTVQP